jgi:hypothetical protein
MFKDMSGVIESPLMPAVRAVQQNPHIQCYVGMALRAGFLHFVTALEWRYFRPQTPRNQFLEFFAMEFKDLPFGVACIDSRMVPPGAVDALLAEVQLKRAAEGQLMVLGGSGPDRFPFSGPNVHFVEYVPGHWAYQNNRALEDQKRDEERAAANLETERPEPPNLPPIPDGALTLSTIFQSRQ